MFHPETARGNTLFVRCLERGSIECEYEDRPRRGSTALRSLLCAPLSLNRRPEESDVDLAGRLRRLAGQS